MNETLIGTTPSTPMTNVQRRTHKNLARAEKHLIAVLTWEAPADQIEAAERRVNRWTRAWKAACRG